MNSIRPDLTRREFLKTASTAVAATALGPALLPSAPAAEPAKK